MSLGGSFTIVKMQSKRRDRPFYRRVAKVGGTKYRKTHGFRVHVWDLGPWGPGGGQVPGRPASPTLRDPGN